MKPNRPRKSHQPRKPRLKPKPLADWTVMVYLAGDNNLSAECVWALTEMQRGMSSDRVNLIAQFDPNDGLARTRRYEITQEGVSQASDSRTKQASQDPPKELEDLTKDLAGWNPRTDEVHFVEESRNARALASQRHRQNEARWRLARKTMEKGQALNADLRPDDLGASQNDTDAASPVTLYNFLSFGVEYYPARHYMVVLSGHSAGIEPSYLLRDDSSGGSMSFRQLRIVFDQLKHDLTDPGFNDRRASKIDILGFDTCLMSMAEICCDLKDRVGIMIGSETYTPASGWPYQSILHELCKSTLPPPDGSKPLSPHGLAKMVVQKYRDFYKDYVPSGVSVALSALDVTKVRGLAPVVKKLAKVLTSELEAEHPELKGKREKKSRPLTDALVLAHWETQSYNGEWYVDLIDFCECLSRRYPKKNVRDACRGIITFLWDKKFIIASEVCGPTYQYSNGVAIYFPWSSVATYFWGFDFAIRSGWGDFLAYYTNLTRRKFRVPKKRLTSDERKKVQDLNQHGGNFLNYARNADKMASAKRASDKRASDKRASDKGLDLLIFNKMASDKRASDKRASDKRASDKRASDKMGSDKSGNPIHSMRNPPVVSLDFDF